jgi:hypothetical protein
MNNNLTIVDCRSISCFSFYSTSTIDERSRRRIRKRPTPQMAGIAAGEPRIIRASRDRSSLAIRRQDEKRAPQSCRQQSRCERILSVARVRPATLASKTAPAHSWRAAPLPCRLRGRRLLKLSHHPLQFLDLSCRGGEPINCL